MLKKNESAFSSEQYGQLLSAGMNTSLGYTLARMNGIPAPGQPYRWMLPDDPSGINGLANMYTAFDKMTDVYTGYSFLQGVVLFLLMLRLIQYLSFQPRLAIVSGTLARMMPDLIHFIVVFVFMACMFAMILTLEFGYRVQEVSTYGDALSLMLEYIVVRNPMGRGNTNQTNISVRG